MSTTNDKQKMLTTVDNPFNPFKEFDAWLNYDTSKGYNTCGYLARITRTSPEISDLDQEQALDFAMDAIIKENVYGVHKIVTEDSFKD